MPDALIGLLSIKNVGLLSIFNLDETSSTKLLISFSDISLSIIYNFKINKIKIFNFSDKNLEKRDVKMIDDTLAKLKKY